MVARVLVVEVPCSLSLQRQMMAHGDYSEIRFSQVPQMGFLSFTGNRAQYWATFRGGTWVNYAYSSPT